MISAKLTMFLTKNEPDLEQQEICTYGLELLIFSIISTAGLILAGELCGFLPHTIIIITIYYSNQTVGGGYHANSHFVCFLTMLGGLLSCFILIDLIPLKSNILFVLSIVSSIYLIKNPLHLHPNKSYLQHREKVLIRQSRIVSSISIIIAIMLTLMQNNYGSTISIGITVSAVSRYIGIKQTC